MLQKIGGFFIETGYQSSFGSQSMSRVNTRITLEEVVLSQKHTKNLHTFSHQLNSFLNLLLSLPDEWVGKLLLFFIVTNISTTFP